MGPTLKYAMKTGFHNILLKRSFQNHGFDINNFD